MQLKKRTQVSLTSLALAFLGMLGLTAPPLFAADDDKDASKDQEEEEAEEDKTEWLVLEGGDIYTGTGALLRGATLLAKDGKIEEIGHAVRTPEDATVVDVTGLRLYPGLVAINSSGLLGRTSSDIEDTIDPFNSNMVLALGNGITSTGVGDAACKLKRYEIEGVLMREDYVKTFTYSISNPSAKRSLEEKFAAASKYLRDVAEWEEKVKDDKELKEPSKKGLDSGVVDVLRNRAIARFNSNERGDLLAIARLAQKFHFRPVIQGCREGWTVADELGRAGAYAIVTPRQRTDKPENLVRDGGSSIENAAMLHARGVQVAVIPGTTSISLMGIAGRDIMHLPVEAAFAVRGGLSNDHAIQAITIVPARILGVDHRIGSLEVGKDCDVIVTDGDLLHYETFVQLAYVDGKLVYDKQEELYFAHIRPRPVTALAPEERTDPGEDASEEAEEEGEDEDEDEGAASEADEGDG